MVASLLPVGVRAAPPLVSFPRDESPHNVSVEWWYFTGHLTGKDLLGGTHHYGFELTFFRDVLAFPVSGYVAHYAVTNLDTGSFKYETRTTVQPDWVPPDGGFDIKLLDWSMSGKNGANSLFAENADLSYVTSLNLNTSLPAALHGGDGLMTYGPLGTSYYYSRPNLSVTGTIVDHGNPVQVSGQAWFDHQWGDFSQTNKAGWDWFSVQLDSGEQYMVYLIKDGSGTVVDKLGTLIKANGSTVDLAPSALSDLAISHWTSPHTSYTYSSGWKVTVPGGFLMVTPQVKDQELVVPSSPDGKYWEGATTVTGTINGQPVRGKGYTELTPPGYFKMQ
ncbi:MAG: AttH component of AttEFGH transport system [Myxococcaceae bacterium]|nr:AttH component of AttEFGH transport system [Myxococcaceae bacterium]